MTKPQLEYFFAQVPVIEARRSYPLAQLEAAVRDFVTPKAIPGETQENDGKPRRPNWKPEELLPYFASMGERFSMSRVAIEDLRKHKSELPMWVLELLDLSLLK